MKVGLRKNTAVRFFAALLAAAGFAFSSCGNLGLDEKSFQNKVSSYFEEMTSNAAVGAYQLDPANAPTDKYGNFCFPYDQECKVTLLLRNPMRYRFDSHNMEFAMAGDNGVTHLPYYDDVGIEQDASDTSKIYITYPVSFLMNNPSGVNISPVVRLYHPVSHASFGVYDRLKLSSNAPPPSPSGTVVVQTNDSPSQWVVCFKLPGKSPISFYHSDITSVSINGTSFATTIESGVISYPDGAALSKTAPSVGLAKNQVTGLDFTPDTSSQIQAQDAYFMTGDDVDQNQRVYTITVTDSAGLSSSVAVSARGFKLSAPDAYLVGGTEAFDKNISNKNTVGQDPNDGSAWVAIRAEAKTAGGLTDGDGNAIDRYDYDPSNAYLVYELHRGTALDTSTLIRTGTLSGVSGKISIPAGTTYVKAFVRKPLYADSDPVVWNCRAVCTNLFVKESGVDDGGEGSKAKPYRTIQKAIDQFQNGITAGDYTANTQLNIRLLSDITPPESFDWSASGDIYAKVDFSGAPTGLVLKIMGEGGRKTLNMNGNDGKVCLNLKGKTNIENIDITGHASESDWSFVMEVSDGADVTYSNGSVYSNGGSQGAYVVVYGGGKLTMHSVSFKNNKCLTDPNGPGALESLGTVECYDCEFTNNIGSNFGAIWNYGTLTMERCTVTGCKATHDDNGFGGAVCNKLSTAPGATAPTLTMTDCVLSGNYAGNKGGAIYNEGSANLTNVTISGCSAGSDDSSGFGGAVFNSSGATATFTGCVIKGNSAAYGAAFYAVVPAAATQTVVFDSCSITGNKCSVATSAAVQFSSSDLIARLKLKGKNTIYDNTIPGTTPGSTKQGNVLYYYLANENSTCKYPIIIDGNISESKIGINIPFRDTDAFKPSAAEPRKFTTGYGFDATNAKKPGLVFFAENGYGITDKEGEAAFAVSGGGMYDPTDFKITTALDGAMAKPNVAKTFNVTITAERKLSDGKFPSEHSPAEDANLVYNPTDHKLYELGGTVPAAGEGSDNPAVTWTAALYNGGQKIASGASITANGLTVTIPAAAMPQPDTYILKITATYMGYTHDASFPISVRNVYGDKSAPTAVGDIVFSDGTATPYSDSLVLDANQKANAVAVIFYTDGDGYLGSRILGVGLKEGLGLMWAPSGTPGYSGVNSSSVGNTTIINHDDSNGSVNWGGVCRADSTAAAYMAAHYPAFNYANTYGVEISGETSGWYLPAYRELQSLLGARDTVNNAIGKIGSPAVSMGTDWYWSSSLPGGLNEKARCGCASKTYDYNDKTNQYNVRAIRKF